jgi:tungstate transport system substrate-binding protein
VKTRLLLAAAAAAALVSCAAPASVLRIATTTSVDNSGLLEAVVPYFERETGIDVQAIAVGSGQAFQIARRGDASLLLTHEPLGERALFDDGLVRYYRKVMFNRFVIAGPGGDPAGVRRARSAADAMARIARSGVLFVSRGDESGTHAREKQLWTAAGTTPRPAHLIETGQGMSATLRIASSRLGYVLTDEATLARLANAVALHVVYADDPALLNTYAVAILTTARPARNEAADRFARWLADGDGQAHIDAFRIHGRQVFFGWPDGVDAASPESAPSRIGS